MRRPADQPRCPLQKETTVDQSAGLQLLRRAQAAKQSVRRRPLSPRGAASRRPGRDEGFANRGLVYLPTPYVALVAVFIFRMSP